MDPNLLTNLGNQVAQSYQQQADLPTMLRTALTNKFAQSSLWGQRQQALSDYLGTPEAANTQLSQPQSITVGGGQNVAPSQNPVGEQVTVPNVYLPPSERRGLVRERSQTSLTNLMNINDLLAAQGGGIDNILNEFSKTLQANTNAKKANFDAAQALADLNLRSQQLGKGEIKDIVDESGQLKSVLVNPYTGAIIKDLGISGSSTTRQAMLEFAQIPTILQQIEQARQLAQGRVQGPLARISAFVGANPEVKAYEDYIQAVATPIARTLFGEKGNLSNQDIQRAVRLLPKVTDTPQEAQKKMGYIVQLANSKAKAIGSQPISLSPSSSQDGTGNRIRVRNKQTGQTGTLLEQDFNSAKYERI